MSQLLQIATRSGTLDTVDGVAAPAIADQGIPFDATGVAVDITTAINHYHQGLPFTAAGRLCVQQAAPSRYGSGGTPFTASGRVAMDTSPVDRYQCGIPYNAAGGIGVQGLAPFLGVTITGHPDPVTVSDPDPAVFSVTAASGDASPLVYQWERNNGGWENVPAAPPYTGTTTDTLTIDPTSDGLPVETSYRCVVSNDQGPTISNSAALTVTSAETFFMLTFNGVDNTLTFNGADNMLAFGAP